MIQKSKYQMDVLTRSYAKKLFDGLSSGYQSSTVTDNADGSKTLTITFTNGDKADITFNPVKGDKGETGTSVQDIKIKEISGVRHLIVTLDDGTEIDSGILPNEQYDDTQIKSDIADLKADKQDKTDNTLDTTDKTVTGAINEVNGNLLDNVTFSADYKNIILNRKSGLNPYTIPISSIIHNAKLTELNDIDSTDIGNGKTLVYDGTTQKHKYVDSTGTDELVKMEASSDAKYLSDLIDKSTIVNDNGTLKVKKLDGQEVTITEINYLKGLTMNVMDLVSAFANGGVKVWGTPVNTYADLSTLDRSLFIDGMSYIVYVLSDETHSNAKTTYLCDKTSETFFGNADSQRNFTTNPIDLANEVTGKLGTSHINVDSLWTLLTINDTYKTLTAKDEVFGTHGAKAMYDELITAIGKKANASDITTHTDDTDIHITSAERTKWNGKEDSSNKTTTIDSTSTDAQYPGAKAVYDNAIKDKNIKTYTNVSQLGLITPISVGDLFVGLPDNSLLRIPCDNDVITGVPHKNGVLIIDKCSNSKFSIEFKISAGGSVNDNTLYIGQLKGVDGTGLTWSRVCTTSVADVPMTTINPTLPSTVTSGNTKTIHYIIKNGWANVTIIMQLIASPKFIWTKIATGLPKSYDTIYPVVSYGENGINNASVGFRLVSKGELEMLVGSEITKNDWWNVTFSYPVAES